MSSSSSFSRHVLCFLLLSICSVSSQPASETEIESESDGASFGIVFDTTSSMSSELNQVKRNAVALVNNALMLPGKPIKDFVFAPFNDPDVPEAKLATDPAEFKGYLEDVTVDGGGDGPEMIYSGLLNALKLVRPRYMDIDNASSTNLTEGDANARVKMSPDRVTKRSTIVVFTDDEAKDVHLLPEVMRLVQTKQVLVIFAVTSGDIEPTFKNVTAISSGLIIELHKSQVSDIMEYIKHMQKPEEVNLMSVTKTGASQDDYPVVVDKTIQEFTASISGNQAKITVRNPEGEIVTDKTKVVPLVDLENAKVIKVNKPEPGTWNITSSSSSNHAFRLTGVSKLDFMSGFSAHKAASMNNTFRLPLRGVKNYVTLTPSNTEAVRRVQCVDIVALDGTLLLTLSVQSVSRDKGIYRTEPFLPPDNAFYLTVEAEDNEGKTIKRTSQTGVVPAPPAAEMLSFADEADGSGSLRCHPLLGIGSALLLYRLKDFNL